MRIFSVFFMLIISTNAFSEVIIPTSVTLLTGTKTNETPLTRLIDGSGLSDASLVAILATVTHDSTDLNEARLFDPAISSVRLDLGGVYDISDVFYWNTNTSVNNDVSSINYDFLDQTLTSINASGTVNIPGPLNLVAMPSNQYSTVISGVQYIDVTFTPRAGANSFAPGEIRLLGKKVVTAVPTLATAVPTLSQWALFLLISLMSLSAYLLRPKQSS